MSMSSAFDNFVNLSEDIKTLWEYFFYLLSPSWISLAWHIVLVLGAIYILQMTQPDQKIFPGVENDPNINILQCANPRYTC